MIVSDVYRPRFHFAPGNGWLNDPNGLVYFDGEYHLFYQALPDALDHTAAKHWGHAVSRDLVRWADLPTALSPDPLGAIWSGSAVVDWHDTSGFFGGDAGLVAIFTNNRVGVQRQSIAHSADRGRTWTKYTGNPVLEDPGYGDFRDPKVFWHAPSNHWVMLVAARDRVVFFDSPNLRDWTMMSEFGGDQHPLAGVWECPDLFPLPVDEDAQTRKWALPISTNSPEGSTQHCFVGDFDGTTFVADTVSIADYGKDDYAAVSWSDIPIEDGRRIWIGWMSNWKYARQTPTGPWRGAMTLPRSLRLQTFPQGLRLIQTPVRELRGLRAGTTTWGRQQITPGSNPLASVCGDALEIEAEFQLETATEFGFRVRVGEDERTTIGYDVNASALFVDRSASGESGFSSSFAGRHDGPLSPDAGAVKMHLFVDRCSVEVFGGGGETTITDLIFPKATSDGVEVYAIGGTVALRSLAVHRLDRD